MIKVAVSPFSKVIVDNIVATAAEGKTIIYFVPQLRKLIPGFNMMNNYSGGGKFGFAVLTGEIITNNALITPILIHQGVAPSFIVSKVRLRVKALSNPLVRGIGFIRASFRAESSRLSQIRISVEDGITSLASFMYTLFCHQCEYTT